MQEEGRDVPRLLTRHKGLRADGERQSGDSRLHVAGMGMLDGWMGSMLLLWMEIDAVGWESMLDVMEKEEEEEEEERGKSRRYTTRRRQHCQNGNGSCSDASQAQKARTGPEGAARGCSCADRPLDTPYVLRNAIHWE